MHLYQLAADRFGLFGRLQQLLTVNDYVLPEGMLRKELLSEPLYPEFLALSRVLGRYSIPHQIVQIPLEVLPQIDALLLMRRQDTQDFALIEQAGEGQVFLHEGSGKYPITMEKLGKLWDGTALYIEPSEALVRKGPKPKNALPRLTLAAVILWVLAQVISVALMESLPAFGLAMVFLTGWAISLSLLAKDTGFGAFAERLCGANQPDTPSNCTKLSKRFPEVLPGLSWSWMALASFTTLCNLLFFLPLWKGTAFPLLLVCCCAGLPITLYSLYVQGVKARTWCRLCLALSVLLWAATALLVYLVPVFVLPDYSDVNYLVACASLSVILSFLAYQGLQQEVAVTEPEKKWRQMMLLPSVREAFLQSLPEMRFDGIPYLREHLPQHLYFLSLNCPHCRVEFLEIDRLLATGTDPESIGWVLTDGTSLSPDDRELAVYLFAHYTRDREECRRVLRGWYQEPSGLSGNAFIRKVVPKDRLASTLEANREAYQQMSQWIKANGLHHYPGKYYEGRRVPDVFDLRDFD